MADILVLAPHPDDEAIGCGGTICLHHDRGDRIFVVFLTSGELGLKDISRERAWRIREKEAERSCETLGVSGFSFLRYPDWYLSDYSQPAAEALAGILTKESPSIIYLPHDGEWHPDHHISLTIARGALDAVPDCAPTLLTYEVWTPLSTYYHVEDVTGVMNRKLKAIRRHRSQVRALAYDRAIRGLNAYRGVTAGGCRYAEIFQHSEARPLQPQSSDQK